MVAYTNCNAIDLPEGITLHKFCQIVFSNALETPCTVVWDEVFRCSMYMLSRLAQFRMLPDVQWILAGDSAQPQIPGHWRGEACRNNLLNSAYLPDVWIERTEIFRCEDSVLADFQRRLRRAYFANKGGAWLTPAAGWLMPFKEEIVRLARSDGPFDTTISLSNQQRMENNQLSDRDGFLVSGVEEYGLYVGLRIIARRSGVLTNGMIYVVVECNVHGATLEETILRFGETGHKRVSASMEQLARDTTLAAGITVASCQGKTLGRTRVQGISSPHMTAENLIVCTNRTRSLRDLRCDA